MIHHVMGVDGTYPLLLTLWLLPLLGGVLCWAFGPQLKTAAGWLASGALLASFVLTIVAWPTATQNLNGAVGAHQALVSWMPGFDFGLLFDPLSLIWTCIITGVGFLIHLYSIGYMHGDRAFARFFAFLNFFVFAMLTLVLSDNFAGLLIGWGLVGLASYFLIGFWFEKPSAVAAARKAFVINVVGDIAIMMAIFIMIAKVGSVGYGDVFSHVAAFGPTLFAVCVCLFIGAAAKSAQLPLHTWLPDAMEGPTPVSALIHAATMVTAGVYLIARCAPLWNASPDAQLLVGTVGGLTALVGAILGTAQWDIKRILAYSTMSQIGYMIMGVGVGAYEGGVAHFFTHAFFKAQLFLGSGIVIHALANEQDVRRMGGLRKKLPFAFFAMLIGVLAICGLPGLSGSFSKDAVIQGALEHGHPWLYVVGVVTAGITAYYMFRMLFLTFTGAHRGEIDPSHLGMRHPELVGTPHGDSHSEHHHAPAWLMNVPVAILIVPTIAAGWLLFGGGASWWATFFATTFAPETLPAAPISEMATTGIVLLIVALGFLVAYLRYGRMGDAKAAAEKLRMETVHAFPALTNAFYFDAALDALFVRPAAWLGALSAQILDPHIIDGAVREIVHLARSLGNGVRAVQSGLLRAYVLLVVGGAVVFIAYYTLIGVHR